MKIFCFGLGYCAQTFLAGRPELKAAGTVRDALVAESLHRHGIDAFSFDGRSLSGEARAALESSDVVLSSIAPNEDGDPSLLAAGGVLGASRHKRLIYLSTIGVYGDHEGAWVDEAADCRSQSLRAQRRVAVEREWLDLATKSCGVDVLRLAGIYGPGRNTLQKLREGSSRRVIKAGQIFNRIHVEDVAQAIGSCLVATDAGGLWNVADDEPAPPEDVVVFAAGLLGVPPPPEEAFETAGLSPAARDFYGDPKRVKTDKIKRLRGFRPLYPTYREGLTALRAEGEGA